MIIVYYNYIISNYVRLETSYKSTDYFFNVRNCLLLYINQNFFANFAISFQFNVVTNNEFCNFK